MAEAQEHPKLSTPETTAKQAKNHVESTPTASKEQTGFANKLRRFINKRISRAELRSSLEESGESPKLEISAKSIPSELHKGRNEDAMFKLPEKRIFGVFDGMGGHADGDKASKLGRDRVAESLEKLSDGISIQQAQDAIRNALVDANQTVYNEAQAKKSNMGSTAVVGYIWEGQGERKAIIGSVGDSRAHIMRGGRLEQITLDDNLLRREAKGDEQKARALQERFSNVVRKSELPSDELSLYDQRNTITQALGTKNIASNVYTVDLQPGDKLLLASDGITDNLTDKEIAGIIAKSSNNQTAVEQLTEALRMRSRDDMHDRRKQDDMSAMVVEVGSSALSKGEPQPAQESGKLKTEIGQEAGQKKTGARTWTACWRYR